MVLYINYSEQYSNMYITVYGNVIQYGVAVVLSLVQWTVTQAALFRFPPLNDLASACKAMLNQRRVLFPS